MPLRQRKSDDLTLNATGGTRNELGDPNSLDNASSSRIL
jgi:hypothetical protein